VKKYQVKNENNQCKNKKSHVETISSFNCHNKKNNSKDFFCKAENKVIDHNFWEDL
jgi:cyclophilin family peptidyl-prolyl cis-trans isomerase